MSSDENCTVEFLQQKFNFERKPTDIFLQFSERVFIKNHLHYITLMGDK